MGAPLTNAFNPSDQYDEENIRASMDPTEDPLNHTAGDDRLQKLRDMQALMGKNFKEATPPDPSQLLALNDQSGSANDAGGADLFIKDSSGKPISPDAWDKGMEAYVPDLKREREGVANQYQNLATLARQPAQTDFSPLYQLGQSLFGQKYNYKAPASAEETGIDRAKLENAIGSQARGLTAEGMAALKDRIAAQSATARDKMAQAHMDQLYAKMGLTQGNADSRLTMQANRQYTQALQPVENTLYSANKIKELVGKILAVDPNDQSEKTIKATKGLMAEINRAQSVMLAGGKQATVHGDMSMEQNTALGDFAKNMTYLTGQAYNTTTRPLLEQALIDTDFLGKNIAANHDIAFHSLIAPLPPKLQEAMTKRYTAFRSGLNIDKQFPKEESPSGGSPFPGGTANAAGQEKPTGPKVGDVVKGYKYKGGKPGDQASWEKVK